MVVVLLGKDALLSHIPHIFPLCFSSYWLLLRSQSCRSFLSFVWYCFCWIVFFLQCVEVFSQYNLNVKLLPVKPHCLHIAVLWLQNHLFFQFFTNLKLNLPKDFKNLLLTVAGNNFMCRCHSLACAWGQGLVVQKRRFYLMEVPKDKANTKISDATTLVELLDVTKVNLFFELCVLKMWKPWDGRYYKDFKELLNCIAVKCLSLSLIIHILSILLFSC